MKRKLFFVYGVFSHALFLAVYAWMAAFVGNFGFGVIPTLDASPHMRMSDALTIDILLVIVFAVQHSLMARPAFKAWWTQFVPQPIERSTYVLLSNIVMIFLMLRWQPVGGVVWDVTHPVGRIALYTLFAIGWVMVPAVSLLINHFDLFGTRQVWLHMRGKEYTHAPFREPSVYRVVRHPLYIGWMTAFWATPTMTATHLVFAALMTGYILLAIPLEERDLLNQFGQKYASYRARVGGLIPRFGTRREDSLEPIEDQSVRLPSNG